MLQDVTTYKVARGVFGVAVRSARIPGFRHFLQGLKPSNRPGDFFLREFWENEFGCSLSTTPLHHQSRSDSSTPTNVSSASHANRSPLTASIPLCSGRETLEGVHNLFTDTTHLRIAYNVYLAVYSAAHALHNLLSCPDEDSSSRGNSSACSSPYNITPKEVVQ